MTQKLITDKNKAADESICKWKQVKWIRNSTNNNNKIQVKTELDNSKFSILTVSSRQSSTSTIKKCMKVLYSSAVPIWKAKFNDLNDCVEH